MATQELVPKTCQLAASDCCSGAMATAQRNPGQRWPWGRWMRAEAPDAWMKTEPPIRSVAVLINDTQFSKPARSQHFHPCVDLECLWGPETFCLEDSDFGHIHANTAHSCWLFIAQETGNTKGCGRYKTIWWPTQSYQRAFRTDTSVIYTYVHTHTHMNALGTPMSLRLPNPAWCGSLCSNSQHGETPQGSTANNPREEGGWAAVSWAARISTYNRADTGQGGRGQDEEPEGTRLSSDNPVGGLRTCKGTQWQSPLQHPRGVCSPGRSEHTVGCPRQRSAGAPAIKSDCAQQLRALLLVSKSIISFVQGKPYFEAEWTHSTVAGTHFILHLDAWAAWRSRVLAHQPHAPHHSI